MVTVSLQDGKTEIPIGAEFGFELSSLDNPESTKPSAPFDVKVTDYKENLVAELTEEEAKLAKFVMHATKPASLGRTSVDNYPKYALEPTLIKMSILTTHLLPASSQLLISAPKQLGLPEDLNEMKCWIDSSPFGDVECDFDRDAYTFLLKDINPHGALRGGTELKI